MLLESIRVCRVGCRSWFCSTCSYRKGLEVQTEWQAAIATWDAAVMVTLTLDPKLFAGPSEAYGEARKNIGRLIRDLRRRGVKCSGRWVGVLECHESGWPHFHLIVEAQFIPHGLLQELWCSYGMIGRRGVVDIRARRRGQTRAGMVQYVTKYLMKCPKGGWPDWVMNNSVRVFRVLRCRGSLGPVAPMTEVQAETEYRKRLCPAAPVAWESERRCIGPRVCRSHRERVSSCGSVTAVHRVYRILSDDGEIRRERVRFFGWFFGPAWQLRQLCGVDPESREELDVACLRDAWGVLEGKRWIGNRHGICSYSNMAVH